MAPSSRRTAGVTQGSAPVSSTAAPEMENQSAIPVFSASGPASNKPGTAANNADVV